MQVKQLAVTGQGSCGTPGTIPSARCKHFSCAVQSVSQEHKPYITQSHKNGSVLFLKIAKQTEGEITADIIRKDESTQLL